MQIEHPFMHEIHSPNDLYIPDGHSCKQCPSNKAVEFAQIEQDEALEHSIQEEEHYKQMLSF